MKNKFFTTLLILIISISVNAQYVIRLNIAECINCTSKLAFLKNHISLLDEIHIILPEEYKNDSKYIDKKFQIEHIDKKYIFSDSAYYSLHQGPESMIYFYKNFSIQKSSKLVELEESFFYSANEEPCFENTNSDPWIKDYGHVILTQFKSLGRITFYNMLTKQSIEFGIDSSWTEAMYKEFYGADAYRAHLEVLQDILEKQTHTVQSEILFALPMNDSVLSFLATAYFFHPLEEKKIKAKKEYFIIERNVINSSIVNVYHIDQNLLPDNYILNDFFYDKKGDSYFFQIINSNYNARNNLAEFHLKENKIQFKRFTSSKRSENYYKYDILNNFLTPIFSDGLYSEYLSDVFYDIYSEKTIKIPIRQIEFESLHAIKNFLINLDTFPKTYGLLDLKRNTSSYEVLYKSFTGEYYVVIIDKNTNAAIDTIRLDIGESTKLRFDPYFDKANERSIKYLKKDEKCFTYYKY